MELSIDGSLNHIDFSAAHFIPTIEKCSRLHGHNYYLKVSVSGEPLEGILIDYGLLKTACRKSVDAIDHKIIVPRSSRYSTCDIDGDYCKVSYNGKTFVFPVSDVYFLDKEMSSSELLSESILDGLKGEIFSQKNIRRITVCVFESPGQGACSEASKDE